jgi:cell division protein FtsW
MTTWTSPADLAPQMRPGLPETGLSKGWEGTALWLLVLGLLGFGLVNLYSASSFLAQRQNLPDHFYVLRQGQGALVGLVLMFVASRVPYTLWRRIAWPMVFGVAVALILTLLPWTTAIAPEINGARRWLQLRGVTFQPAEFAKLAILVWTAHMAVRKRHQFQSFRFGMLPFLVVWTLLLGPTLLQPDFSTALLAGVLGALVLFVAGARMGHFVLLSALLTPVVLAQLRTGFRAERLLSYGGGESAVGVGYQTHQSLIALGSGGVRGVGFGEGRQKFGFLPEPHNDFIFSMIGEEWGFVGVMVLVGLYLGLVVIGFRVVRRVPDLFGQLLAVGIVSFLALHAILHMSVGLGLVPTTGLPLPLVSYGRSNLLVTLALVGILLSIDRGDPRALRPGVHPAGGGVFRV